MIGRKVAHYSITGELGAGGMGQVWRARDGKLGRDVALKVLPQELAGSPERLARFRREAQLLASLSHPNIGAIHGLEELDGSFALVLELIEGPTLDERLAEGKMPLDEVLRIAREIADALEAAHAKGIVHRDLKPANVKLTEDGRVKVLDFGLAKAMADEASGSSAEGPASAPDSPTMTSPVFTSPLITGNLTAPHVLLGTAAYMSPEQARGLPADERADVWSFGVVLFEMLTGQRLFASDTLSDTIASVLKVDPDFAKLPADLPPGIRRMLHRCLRRKRRHRLRHIADARLAIVEYQEGLAEPEPTASSEAPAAAPEPAKPRWILPAVAAIAGAALAAVAVIALRPSAPETDFPSRTFVMAEDEGVEVTQLSLSPDGSALAYVSGGFLHVRDFRTGEDRRLDEGVRPNAPAWSPDGEWIVYGSSGGLDRIRPTGGQPTRVAATTGDSNIDNVGGIHWGDDDRIRFTSGSGSLWAVSAQGGDPVVFCELSEGESDFHELAAVPGGRGWFVVVHHTNGGYDRIDAVLPDGTRRPVLRVEGHNLMSLRWSPSGHLIYVRAGTGRGIWAVRVDEATLEASGEPILVVPEAGHPTVSADGTFAYRLGSSLNQTVVAVTDRRGQILKELGPAAEHWPYPTFSPDGRTLTLNLDDEDTSNLWQYDVERGTRSRVTAGEESQDWCAWSSDGSEFWWTSGPELVMGDVRVRPSTSVGPGRVVAQGAVPAISADDRYLFLSVVQDRQAFDLGIFILDLEAEDAEPQPLVATEVRREYCGFPSPTDRLFAYASSVTGEEEIFISTYPEPGPSWRVSTSGGSWPQWRGDGRELYYAQADSILAVSVEPRADGVKLGTPELLFRRARYVQVGGSRYDGFAVTRDGQTFAFTARPPERSADRQKVAVLTNWASRFGE